jgi:twitching motility two-component system response regulator PilG
MKVALHGPEMTSIASTAAHMHNANANVHALGLTLRQGVMAAKAQEFDRARQLLEQVTATTPDDPVAWYWLAISSPSADAAIPCLRRVLALDPTHPKAPEALARLLVTEARGAASAGNLAAARALAAESAQLVPADPAPWLALASLAADHTDRIDALRQASTLRPEDSRLRTQLRQALLARGVMIAAADRVEARARFNEAAELNPLDARVWQALATLSDSRAESLPHLRQLIRVAPDHRRGRLSLHAALVAEAHECAAAGHNDAACERWREAIALNGGDVESWLGLAAATSDHDEAARAVESAYESDPLDERAVAAMDRLRGPQFDPSAEIAPDDAFSRFESAAGALAPFELPEDAFDPGDSLLDAFAQLADEAAPEPAPPVVPAPPLAPAPVVEAPAPIVEVAEPVLEAASPATASATRTVMVVDDSPTIRKILGLTLERAGYAVVAEPDGESALARLAEQVPDLILLDISMPGLDGYEVCKRIKQDERTGNVPVIMLSGKGAFFDKVKGKMAGATEYLTKPFETPAVLAVVTSHCGPVAELAANG